MSRPVITYFAFPGRAEPLRLAAVAGKIEFTNKVISMSEFPEVRVDFPLGQVPVLELKSDDGGTDIVMNQSDDILRYLGKLGGLYPNNDPVAALKIDAMISNVNDFEAPIIVSLAGYRRTLVKDEDMTEDDKLGIRSRVIKVFIPKVRTICSCDVQFQIVSILCFGSDLLLLRYAYLLLSSTSA